MNFIFDIGNVLFDFKPVVFLEGLFADKAVAKKMLELVFLSPEWVYMDQGVMAFAEVCETICRRESEYEQDIRKTMQNVNTMFTPIYETIELLPKVKELGHDLYYLSNIGVEIRDHLLREHRFFDLFEGGVFSCDIHITKPSSGIYRHLLGKNRLDPEDCLFFDDMEINVEAALKEGITSVVFTGAHCVKPFLR